MSPKDKLVVRGIVGVLLLATLVFWAYEASENPSNQLFGKTVVSGPGDQKIVALTYDDGPNPPFTTSILQVLRREHVHATFFLVGRAVAAYPGVVRQEVRDGNAVGNHTWDHAHLLVLNPAQLRSTLSRTDQAIFAASGVHSHLMRPPYGARDWMVLNEARKLGYTPVMWSVPLAKDWEYPSASVIAKRILAHVGDGSIIVLHDGNLGLLCAREHLAKHICDRRSDIGATRLIVESLKGQGYRFVTIPQLLAEHGKATHRPGPGAE